MSERSRKDLAPQSVCSPDSLLVNPQDGETVAENNHTGGAIISLLMFFDFSIFYVLV